jgi:geranylgeranyl diphosphate synthase type I
VFGDPAVTGKPAGDDLREGKRTLLVSLGLRQAERQDRPADAARLRSAIGRHDLDEPAVDVIRDLLVDLGAVAAVESRIDELRDQALATLAATPVAEPAASELARLAVAATRRNH